MFRRLLGFFLYFNFFFSRRTQRPVRLGRASPGRGGEMAGGGRVHLLAAGHGQLGKDRGTDRCRGGQVQRGQPGVQGEADGGGAGVPRRPGQQPHGGAGQEERGGPRRPEGTDQQTGRGN